MFNLKESLKWHIDAKDKLYNIERWKTDIHYALFSSVFISFLVTLISLMDHVGILLLWSGNSANKLTFHNTCQSSRNDQHPSCCLRNVLRGSAYEEVQTGHHGSCQVCTGNISVGLLPLSVLLCLGLWECQSGWYHCVIWWVYNLISWIFKTLNAYKLAPNHRHVCGLSRS